MLKIINSLYLIAFSLAGSVAFGQAPAHLPDADPCQELLNQCGIVNLFTYGVDELGNFMPRPGVNFEKTTKKEVYVQGKRELHIGRDTAGRIMSVDYKSTETGGDAIYIWGDPDSPENNQLDGTLYVDPQSTETVSPKKWLEYIARKLKKKPEEVPENLRLEKLAGSSETAQDQISFAKLTGFYASHYLKKKNVDRKLNVKFKYDQQGQCLIENLNMNYPESDEKGKEENHDVNISEQVVFERCQQLSSYSSNHEFTPEELNEMNLCKKYGLMSYFKDNPAYSSEGLEQEQSENTMKMR